MMVNLESILEYIAQLHTTKDEQDSIFFAKASGGSWAEWQATPQQLQMMFPEFAEEFLTDSYMTPNAFYKQRRAIMARRLNALWVDLDCYKAELTPEEALGQVTIVWDKWGDTPRPNYIMKSCRGLWLFWLLEPIGAWAEKLALWTLCQNSLCEIFKPFGADPKSKDVTRVSRIPTSINSKSNTPVTYEQLHDDRYPLQEFSRLIGVSIGKHQEKKKRTKVSHARFNFSSRHFTKLTLDYSRARDIETLNELRGGIEEGSRELTLFLYRMFIEAYATPEEALRQTLDLNQTFNPPLPQNEAEKATKARGKYYSYRNKTLIELLGITPEEQKHLSVIIGEDEKRRRRLIIYENYNRTKRGRASREQYREEMAKLRETTDAKVLRAYRYCPGATQQELAGEIGINQSTVSRSLRRLGIKTRPVGRPRKHR